MAPLQGLTFLVETTRQGRCPWLLNDAPAGLAISHSMHPLKVTRGQRLKRGAKL